MDNTEASKKRAIDRFLADNPELEKLSDRLATFNVFRALRIEEAEIRHSNVLAWLLNPEESHGLGDIVLRRVFSNILLKSDINIEGISAAKVELMDFVDIEVRREWRNIDLLIIDQTNNFVILIENKIYSRGSPGQLAKYQKLVNEEFPSFLVVPVFLTLTGQQDVEDEKTNGYISYSYLQLLDVFENLFSQRLSQLAEPVAIFITQYMDTLRRLTMKDESLVKLCKTIYRRHRDAIDLIVKYGMVGAGQQAVLDVLSEERGYEILYSRPASVWFLPRSWAELIPENSTAWTHLTRPVSVACWMEFYQDKAYIHFELTAMEPPELRLACLEKLKEAGFNVAAGAFNEERKYSRFYGKGQKVSDMTDYEEVRKGVEKLLEKAKAEFPKAETVFREVFKNKKVEK